MYVESKEKKGESSAWLARLSAPARRFRRASIEEGEPRMDTKGIIIEPRMDTNGHE